MQILLPPEAPPAVTNGAEIPTFGDGEGEDEGEDEEYAGEVEDEEEDEQCAGEGYDESMWESDDE